MLVRPEGAHALVALGDIPAAHEALGLLDNLRDRSVAIVRRAGGRRAAGGNDSRDGRTLHRTF